MLEVGHTKLISLTGSIELDRVEVLGQHHVKSVLNLSEQGHSKTTSLIGSARTERVEALKYHHKNMSNVREARLPIDLLLGSVFEGSNTVKGIGD